MAFWWFSNEKFCPGYGSTFLVLPGHIPTQNLGKLPPPPPSSGRTMCSEDLQQDLQQDLQYQRGTFPVSVTWRNGNVLYKYCTFPQHRRRAPQTQHSPALPMPHTHTHTPHKVGACRLLKTHWNSWLLLKQGTATSAARNNLTRLNWFRQYFKECLRK